MLLKTKEGKSDILTNATMLMKTNHLNFKPTMFMKIKELRVSGRSGYGLPM